MGQSPLFYETHLLEMGLSDPESRGSVSSVVQGSLAGDGPLSDPESHGSVSFAARGLYARDESFSGLASLPLIALRLL